MQLFAIIYTYKRHFLLAAADEHFQGQSSIGGKWEFCYLFEAGANLCMIIQLCNQLKNKQRQLHYLRCSHSNKQKTRDSAKHFNYSLYK